jgi:hypothetical protein
MFNYFLKNIKKVTRVVAFFHLLFLNSSGMARENLIQSKVSFSCTNNNNLLVNFFEQHQKAKKNASIITPSSTRKRGLEEKNDVLITRISVAAPFNFYTSDILIDYKKDILKFSIFLPSLRGPPIVL